MSVELFLLKDAILYLGFFSLVMFDTKRFAAAIEFYRPREVIAFIFWTVILLLALGLSGISLTSLSGFRYYMAALPILALHPAAFPTLDSLYEILSRYVLLALLVCVLGFFQFLSHNQ